MEPFSEAMRDKLDEDLRIIRWFRYDHLDAELQRVSQPFHELAVLLMQLTPLASDERTVALRKLLEAKDAAVRAHLYVRQLVDTR
jgi:hypothetical protein